MCSGFTARWSALTLKTNKPTHKTGLFANREDQSGQTRQEQDEASR